MVELLSRTLDHAAQDYESTVICLDWYSGHRTAEVADTILSRGHVLLLHGGGTTAYEQVNDTHLHATLQRRMKALEVAVFDGQLSECHESGVQKAASHSRQDLCLLVESVWEDLDHTAISQRGYEQTGPLLPLTGPIYKHDVCRDGGSSDDLEMETTRGHFAGQQGHR